MLLDQELLSFFNKQVQNFQRGVFCPAEMWYLLASRMSAETALPYLNAITAVHQVVLRNSYLERPSSLNGESFADQKAVRQLIEQWCQQVTSHPAA